MAMDPVVHFEMVYQDAQRVVDFYTKVFGWRMQILGEEMSNYVLAATCETDAEGMIKNPGMINGGFYKNAASPNSTTHVVLSVDDLTASMEKVKTAGGTLTSEPMNIPGIGKYISFKDTEGNHVGMLQALPMAAS